MPERLWTLLLVMVVAILIAVFFQERNKNQSLEEEKSAYLNERGKLAIEASQLKQQVTQMKEQQYEMDRESRRSSAKLAALEENLEKLEDERTAWEDERDRFLIREKHLKQQHDECRSQLKAADSAKAEASAELSALEEDLEELEDEITAWKDERDGLLIREQNLKQQHDDCRSQLKAADSATTEDKIRRMRTESDLEELRKELFLCNEKTMTQEVLLAKALSGEFKTEEVPKTGGSGNRAYPMLAMQFKAEAAFKGNDLIEGIAMLNEDIFAVNSGGNVIAHLDSTTLSTKQTLLLEGYENLKDIQPCNQSESLFVIATESTVNGLRVISSVDPYNKKTLHSWAVDRCIERLSVTEDCHVITACADLNKISEYSSTGHLVREIVLSPETGIVSPRLALKMTDGNYLVSYNGNSFHIGVALAILNSNGDVLKSYSDSSQRREYVDAMVIDRLGNILVAEMYNGRVLLLSSDLEFKTELMSREHGIRVILAILLDEVNGRLFVADCKYNANGSYYDNARILMFDMQ